MQSPTPSPSPEPERLSAEDLARFEQEALPLIDVLYGGAIRMTRDPSDAGDLVQETFLRAFRSWTSFEPGTNLKAWLFRIMTNLYISSYRAKQRGPAVLYTDSPENFDLFQAMSDGAQGISRSAESIVLDELLDEEVKGALAALPNDFRMVVLLADLEGFSYKEIAEMLDIPIGTVMSRLHRGRKALQKTLWHLAQSRAKRGEVTHSPECWE